MLAQQLVNGLTLGSTYALVALGFTLVFGILGMINFAHGEIFMLGAYMALLLVTVGKLGIFWALIGGMVGAAILGMLIERVSFRPLRKVSILAPLISTIGLSIFLRSLAQIVFGAESTRFPVNIKTEFYQVGPFQISLLQIIILAISFGLMSVFQVFIQKTKVGKAMRATSESLYTAGLLGIPVDRIILLSFAVASALGGVAGVLVGLNFNAISPLMGKMVGLKGLTIIILGGMGNITGAMVGGLFLGFVEVLSVGYLTSSYRDAVAFALMFLVLLIRPTGLFGRVAK
ncbi:MAG: branched-chain amino acid ABC transporter permease [Deltaproteobacteria bacterium]|jgi:branched-chain amino acid transport system permease protein|nr:branched-chain amino acid ABC transporter permease [Deltaproteobacteria bacterium]